MDNTKTGELLDGRLSPGALDALYIECYLDNPSNKSAALRRAAELAGVKCDTGRQRAQEIHRRLQHPIDAGLLKRMMEGATLGYSVTYALAADDKINPAIRLKAAEDLIIYAGKAKPSHVKAVRKADDIKKDIEQTRIRIEQLTGAET